ncbi:MAG: YihY/virulence factor BrkB family protein [Burkholderiales bacterium]
MSAQPAFRRLLPASPGAAVRALGRFALGVLRDFRANQGLLLAGAVAYYALLSLVPMLILVVIVLSQLLDPQLVIATIAEYLEFIVPGYADAVAEQLRLVLAHRDVVGGALLVSMLFFSSLAFTVLENAMSVIFLHRVDVRHRHFLVSAVLPYVFIVLLGAGLLAATLVSGRLATLATRDVALLGTPHSLSALSNILLYLAGVAGEILVVTSIYLVMPVGSMRWRHALIGGVTACVLWEITRHALVWYYATLSQIQVVYGSFAAAIAVLLSVEVAETLLLFGAQVIASYERAIRARPAPERDSARLRVVPARQS